jgi:hypothetical protein
MSTKWIFWATYRDVTPLPQTNRTPCMFAVGNEFFMGQWRHKREKLLLKRVETYHAIEAYVRFLYVEELSTSRFCAESDQD